MKTSEALLSLPSSRGKTHGHLQARRRSGLREAGPGGLTLSPLWELEKSWAFQGSVCMRDQVTSQEILTGSRAKLYSEEEVILSSS